MYSQATKNESGFRPPLCTYRLNWARRTSWGWWDEWDDTVLQTQDSKFEPWRSEAEHATSRSRRLPTILTFTRGWGRNSFLFLSNRRDREPNPVHKLQERKQGHCNVLSSVDYTRNRINHTRNRTNHTRNRINHTRNRINHTRNRINHTRNRINHTRNRINPPNANLTMSLIFSIPFYQFKY